MAALVPRLPPATFWLPLRGNSGGLRTQGASQLREQLRELRWLVVRVQSARVREHPDLRGADRFILQTHRRFRSIECRAIGADADDGEEPRCVAFHFAREDPAAFDELFARQLVGGGGGAGDDVGDADAEVQELALLRGREEARREAGAMERGPEAVAGSSEMLLDGSGVEAGIDAAEEDVEVRRDDVGKGRVRGCSKIGLGGLQKFRAFQKFSARPPMYFFERPSGVSESMRYGEFSARASSSPRSNLMSIGR